jgi:hypothetical protein
MTLFSNFISIILSLSFILVEGCSLMKTLNSCAHFRSSICHTLTLGFGLENSAENSGKVVHSSSYFIHCFYFCISLL